MLHVRVNKVEIYFSKIGIVDSKWSNLNAPGSPHVLHLFQFTSHDLIFSDLGHLLIDLHVADLHDLLQVI